MGMKFIRGMIYPNPNSGTKGACWRMKWTYEFWGFCVNGGSNPLIPGGFATNNGLNLKTNFTGGTNLMAYGTDGSHTAVTGDLFSGECIFTSPSAIFSTPMVGKALVMWKPGSNSSEDSIYIITGVLNTTQITINVNTGGTPNPTTKHPSMTARTGVCYRVVDMVAATDAGYVNGSFMVLQVNQANTINSGQGNSQIMLNCQGSTHSNTPNGGDGTGAFMGVGLSGSGSWDGTSLDISNVSGAGVSPIQITTAVPHGLITGQSVSIYGVAGNTNCNGMFLVTVTGTNTFTLTGGLSGGTYPTLLGTTTGNGTFNATVHSLSNGVTLPTSLIWASSVAGFDPYGGTIFVTTTAGIQTVTYTSHDGGNRFFGTAGGTGTMATGNAITRLGSVVYKGFQNDGYTGMFAVDPNTNQAWTGGQTAITIIADETFMICHMRQQDIFQFNDYLWFHWEIPKRLYPEGVDKHPIAFNGMGGAFNTGGGGGGIYTTSSTAGYGGGFLMRTHSSDVAAQRKYRTLVKAIRGDGTPDVFGQSLSDYRVGYNTIAGTVPVSDALLALPDVANQFSLGRVRLRTVKFTGTHVPIHHRIGLNGEFIQLSNGVCWPWDNTIIPGQLILFGI